MGDPFEAATPWEVELARAARELQTWLGLLPTPRSSGDEDAADRAEAAFQAHLAEARRLREG